jgi:hypothetical protein
MIDVFYQSSFDTTISAQAYRAFSFLFPKQIMSERLIQFVSVTPDHEIRGSLLKKKAFLKDNDLTKKHGDLSLKNCTESPYSHRKNLKACAFPSRANLIFTPLFPGKLCPKGLYNLSGAQVQFKKETLQQYGVSTRKYALLFLAVEPGSVRTSAQITFDHTNFRKKRKRDLFVNRECERISTNFIHTDLCSRKHTKGLTT